MLMGIPFIRKNRSCLNWHAFIRLPKSWLVAVNILKSNEMRLTPHTRSNPLSFKNLSIFSCVSIGMSAISSGKKWWLHGQVQIYQVCLWNEHQWMSLFHIQTILLNTLRLRLQNRIKLFLMPCCSQMGIFFRGLQSVKNTDKISGLLVSLLPMNT